MPSATVLEAFVVSLKSKTAVTSLLPGGPASIFTLGRVQGQQGSPYVTVAELLSRGFPNSQQFSTKMRVRAYFGDNSGNASMKPIAEIIVAIKKSMHNANLGDISGIGFMECRWDGYHSGSMYDYGSRDYFQEVRFDIRMGQTLG